MLLLLKPHIKTNYNKTKKILVTERKLFCCDWHIPPLRVSSSGQYKDCKQTLKYIKWGWFGVIERLTDIDLTTIRKRNLKKKVKVKVYYKFSVSFLKWTTLNILYNSTGSTMKEVLFLIVAGILWDVWLLHILGNVVNLLEFKIWYNIDMFQVHSCKYVMWFLWFIIFQVLFFHSLSTSSSSNSISQLLSL